MKKVQGVGRSVEDSGSTGLSDIVSDGHLDIEIICYTDEDDVPLSNFVRSSKLNAPSVSVSANLSGFTGPSNSGSNPYCNVDASQFEGEQAVMSACIQ